MSAWTVIATIHQNHCQHDDVHHMMTRSHLDYASDTEAVQSPPRSLRNGRLRSTTQSRSNSLPRTFNREALLRHPELSMEIDRLSDTMSDLGERLSVASVSARLSARGARSPSSFSTISQVNNFLSFRIIFSKIFKFFYVQLLLV